MFFSLSRTIALLLPLAALLSPSGSVTARTYLIPHLFETRGLTSSNTFVFDANIILTYNQQLSGTNQGSANVDLFLYDDATGLAMRSATGAEVCNPCSFQVSGSRRKLVLSVDDLLVQKGGFIGSLKLGYGIAVVGGENPDAVNVQVMGINSHSSTSDLESYTYATRPVRERTSSQRTLVLPHVLESSGTIANTTFTFDTILYVTYAGGLPGGGSQENAAVDLYLYDDNGDLMVSGTGASVCNPCSFSVGSGMAQNLQHKRTISFDNLITTAGGFGPNTARSGYAILQLGGLDPEGLEFEAFLYNSHSSPFDLSVFTFEPQPIAASAQARTYVIPHTLERSGSITNPLNFDTAFYATYTAGQAGTTAGTGATVELFLYEVNGQPLSGSSGTAVCNPCSFNLSASNRKQVISLESLFLAAGGFPLPVKLGFGVLNVAGSNPEAVSLQGLVLNSISSSSNLNVFDALLLPLTDRAINGSTNFQNRRVYSFPHYFEKSGRLIAPYAFDTLVYVAYVGGRDGISPALDSTVKLYLYDDNAVPVTGQNGPVCNPCTFSANFNTPKLVLSLEDLILANGGRLTSEVQSGFVLLVVEGDVSSVQTGIWPINTHTSPFDLSAMTYGGKFLENFRLLSPFLSVEKQPEGIVLNLATTPGFNYAIETSSSILSTNWNPLTQFLGNGTVQTFTDLDQSATQKYYRAREF